MVTNTQEQDNRVVKLFHHISYNTKDIRAALTPFYKLLNESSPQYREVVRRITISKGAASELNLPIIVHGSINAADWTPENFNKFMLSDLDDLKESIINGFLVGSLKKFAQINGIDEQWILTGTPSSEAVDTPDTEDPNIFLPDAPEDEFMAMSLEMGELDRVIGGNVHKGSKERLVGRRHMEVILPSTEHVLKEMGSSVDAVELIEAINESENGVNDGVPVLPTHVNATGHQPFDIDAVAMDCCSIRPNLQPLPKSRTSASIDFLIQERKASVEKIVPNPTDPQPVSASPLPAPEQHVETKTQGEYDIETCIRYIARHLPRGSSLTIVGEG